MNIELVPTLERLVQDKVRSGHYRSASDVVGEALRLMEERDRRNDDLRDQLLHALETQRRGDLLDGEAIFDRLEAELEALDDSGV